MATSTTKTMILVQVTVAPESVPKFLQAFQEIVQKCISEPECDRFEVLADSDQEGLFHWVETWNASKDWLMNVQVKKPYYDIYEDITKPLWIKDRVVHFLEHVPSIPPYLKE